MPGKELAGFYERDIHKLIDEINAIEANGIDPKFICVNCKKHFKKSIYFLIFLTYLWLITFHKSLRVWKMAPVSL